MKNIGKHTSYMAGIISVLIIAALLVPLCFLGIPAYGEKPVIWQGAVFAKEIFDKAAIPKESKVLKSKPASLPNSVPTEAVGNLKDLHAFYLVNMPEKNLKAFIKTHLTKQEVITSKGSFYNTADGYKYSDITVSIKTNLLRAYLAQLVYTFTSGKNPRITYLRVDSNTFYLNSRDRVALVAKNASIGVVLYTKPSLVHKATGKISVKINPHNAKRLIRIYDSEPLGPVTVMCMENSLLYTLEFHWGHNKILTAQASVCGSTLYTTYDGKKHINVYESCSLTNSITEILGKQHLVKASKFLAKFVQDCQ